MRMTTPVLTFRTNGSPRVGGHQRLHAAEWNAGMFQARAFRVRLPCRSAVGTPMPSNCVAGLFAPCLVRVKIVLSRQRDH